MDGHNVPTDGAGESLCTGKGSHTAGTVGIASIYHCKKGKVVLTQFGYLSFLSLVCIVKHSGVPLPALDSTQIKNLFGVPEH